MECQSVSLIRASVCLKKHSHKKYIGSTITAMICICHVIAISPTVDLFVPIALITPKVLVMLVRDMVTMYGTGDVVCKQLSPGASMDTS